MDANSAVSAARYWAPMLSIGSLVFLSIGLPVLRWAWQIKDNHLPHLQQGIDEIKAESKEQTKVLIEIRTLLSK